MYLFLTFVVPREAKRGEGFALTLFHGSSLYFPIVPFRCFGAPPCFSFSPLSCLIFLFVVFKFLGLLLCRRFFALQEQMVPNGLSF